MYVVHITPRLFSSSSGYSIIHKFSIYYQVQAGRNQGYFTRQKRASRGDARTMHMEFPPHRVCRRHERKCHGPKLLSYERQRVSKRRKGFSIPGSLTNWEWLFQEQLMSK